MVQRIERDPERAELRNEIKRSEEAARLSTATTGKVDRSKGIMRGLDMARPGVNDGNANFSTHEYSESASTTESHEVTDRC